MNFGGSPLPRESGIPDAVSKGYDVAFWLDLDYTVRWPSSLKEAIE
jgi:hypothetical protein